jgi:hypothetical protein
MRRGLNLGELIEAANRRLASSTETIAKSVATIDRTHERLRSSAILVLTTPRAVRPAGNALRGARPPRRMKAPDRDTFQRSRTVH